MSALWDPMAGSRFLGVPDNQSICQGLWSPRLLSKQHADQAEGCLALSNSGLFTSLPLLGLWG